MSAPTTKTAWVYIRESKDASASGHSPDTQLRLCRELASEQGVTVTRVALEIKPGSSMSKRPTWKQVERAALRHDFDALLVWEYSRISRSTSDWLHFISRALNAGVEVLSTDPQEKAIDWHSPLGRAMLGFIGGVNEIEREKTRKRTMENNRTRVLKGMPLVGATPPYGYRWVDEKTVTELTGAARERKARLVPDEPDAEHPDAVTATRLRAIWDYFDTPESERTLGAGAAWLNYAQPQGQAVDARDAALFPL